MRALVLDRPSIPDILRMADLPVPEPGVGQIRVRVEACGLNPVDYQSPPQATRTGPGRTSWAWTWTAPSTRWAPG